jgi:vancomycin permeability regulator SanA
MLRAGWIGVLAGVLLLAAPFALVGAVWAATSGLLYADPAATPRERVAIVFGAGVRPDGRPSPMLADRVDAAVALYKAGAVAKLLMSGDNGQPGYDEPTAMRAHALARGVPAEDVVLDYAGFSTYETCARARSVFGLTAATLVTQRYHLPRAVYVCRQLGVDAIGLGVQDWGVYPDALLMRYSVRELAATVHGLWLVHVTRPSPTFLGPPVAV